MRDGSHRSQFKILFVFPLLITAIFTGCESVDNNPNVKAGHADGSALQPGTPDNPETLPAPPATGDPDLMTIAVKFVALKGSASETETPTRAEATTLLSNMSNVWAQCKIRFFLETYETPVASTLGLDYTPANHSQLDAIREEFDNRKSALLVKTGTWDRSGDLGYDGSNGFSSIPPTNPEGAVVESWVALNTLLIAHEFGHMIGGLGHTGSGTNLMNHFVTTSTTELDSDQCDSARATMKEYHSAWIR